MPGKKAERSFVDIVREMVAEGENFEEVIGNLSILGLKAEDAKKLVGIVETKNLPEINETIQKMVKVKFDFADKAWQMKRKRRAASATRRRIKSVKNLQLGISEVLAMKATGTVPLFRKKIDRYVSGLREQEEARKEILAFLLELENRKLERWQKSKLRKAIDFFS